MNVIRYPQPVDLQQYSPAAVEPERFYGLPASIQFCCSCTYSNQKPNSDREYKHTRDSKKPTVSFNVRGICSACEVAEKKKNIDWAERDRELRQLCDRYRRHDGRYDCVVPGSGGKDTAIPSGPLHDAAEMARLMPTVMVFSKSSPPVSHTKVEDTPEADLRVAIEAYGKTVQATLAAAADGDFPIAR